MPKSRIEKAQDAFKKQDVDAAKEAHTKKEISSHKEQHKEVGRFLGDFVFGASDGIVTTFAVVSGVEGAHLSHSIVLILGSAKLLADAISMAVGNYLSTKSDMEYIERERQREKWEIENVPEGEKEEIREIYKKKGFKGKDLKKVVDVITSDKEVWLNTMMMQELGLTDTDKTPVKSALATFFAFLVAGVIPLVAFVAALFTPIANFIDTFVLSAIMTGLTLFVVGSLRSWATGKNWIRSGLEMLVVGGLAAGVAYGVGYFLQSLGV